MRAGVAGEARHLLHVRAGGEAARGGCCALAELVQVGALELVVVSGARPSEGPGESPSSHAVPLPWVERVRHEVAGALLELRCLEVGVEEVVEQVHDSVAGLSR